VIKTADHILDLGPTAAMPAAGSSPPAPPKSRRHARELHRRLLTRVLVSRLEGAKRRA
jgi:hypothetical protein